ncbi:hypothetical protein GpartN1_g5643.t1 [Galdieria partita]|uniref:Uncharacterized protein n=1 Tax=Galdieria partita TaxID=83374 RepID=A0A9C7USN6_9RHOD|nr:hypothetical protein GpartN1_g5643.t1 [Galdieria partita]
MFKSPFVVEISFYYFRLVFLALCWLMPETVYCRLSFVSLGSHRIVATENFYLRKALHLEYSKKVSRLYLLRSRYARRSVCCNFENSFGGSFGQSHASQWKQFDNLYLLRPFSSSFRIPLCVVHFVGGAFVSSISQLAYRSLLEGLAQKGYLVVVTPYDTSFDHVVAAESVNRSFIMIMRQLKEEYGTELPVIGLSHSLGCIVQILSTCLFPQVPFETKGHIFMAYNNKPLNKAVPLYKELLIPSINKVSSLLTPKDDMSSNWKKVSSLFEGLVATTGESVMKSIGSKVFEEQVYPNWQQLEKAWKQLDPLLQEVQRGRDEFHPSPAEIENIIIQKYSQSSVIIRCEDDLIDESLQLYRLLRGRKFYVKMRSVPGTHLTPLEQNTQAVDNFLKTNFQISSSFSKMSNLYRLTEVISESFADIISEQASSGM